LDHLLAFGVGKKNLGDGVRNRAALPKRGQCGHQMIDIGI
jgi:hypothetical protein